jgi:hypothetical protein
MVNNDENLWFNNNNIWIISPSLIMMKTYGYFDSYPHINIDID